MVNIHSLSALSGIASMLGLILFVSAIVAAAGIVGTLVILIVANRADPDPSGKRPFVVYLFAISFLAIWTALVGSALAVSSLFQLIGSHGAGGIPGAIHPVGDMVARGIVFGLIVTGVSVWVLLAHVRRGLAAVSDEPTGSPSRRVAQSYVSGVAFVSLIVVVAAVVVFVYSIFQILGPGTFASAGARVGPFRHLLDSAYVFGAAGVILWSHVKMVPAELSPLSGLRNFPMARKNAAGGPDTGGAQSV